MREGEQGGEGEREREGEGARGRTGLDDTPPRSHAPLPLPPLAPSLFRGPFRPLRHRNYRLFWFGQLVSVTGTWVQSVAQAWLVASLADPTGTRGPGEAGWYLGMVATCGSLPILFGALFGGAVADRVSKRRLLMITQTVMMACAFTLALLTATGYVRIWHVMLTAATLGLATAFDLPARQSFVVEMVGKDDLGGAVALNSSLFNAARLVGPAITGFLLAARVPIAICFALNGLSYVAVLVGLSRIDLPAVRHVSSDQRMLDTLREGLSYVRGAPYIRRILMLVGAFGAFAYSFNVLMPAFVRYFLVPDWPAPEQARAFGMMESVRGMGALAAALTVASLARRGAQTRLLVFGATVSLGGLLLFSTMRSLYPAYAVIALVSFAFVCCNASANTLVQMAVPDAMRGRVMSLYVLLMNGTGPAGAIMAGAVAKGFGAPAAIRAGVWLTLAVFGAGLLAERLRRRS